MPVYPLKQLNQYQQTNVDILDPQTLNKLKSGDWRDVPTPILKCVRCGQGRITMPIVRFFNYDPTRLTCYDCQNQLYGNKRL